VPPGSPTGMLPEQMQDAWIAFARTGRPASSRLPAWEPYAASRRQTMLLGPTCTLVDAPYEAERRFWETHTEAGTLHQAAVRR